MPANKLCPSFIPIPLLKSPPEGNHQFSADLPRPAPPFLLILQNVWYRLEKAVISGRLWYPACQHANQDLPSNLPVSFASPQQYIAAYEALIFEEAREAVLHCKMDRFSHQTQGSILG